MNIQVVNGPVITEKSMTDAGNGRFTFRVDRFADKNTIKKEVEKKFDVHVISVQTQVVKGRTKRVGKKFVEKKLSPWKKATVEVKKGEKIALFDIGGKE